MCCGEGERMLVAAVKGRRERRLGNCIVSLLFVWLEEEVLGDGG